MKPWLSIGLIAFAVVATAGLPSFAANTPRSENALDEELTITHKRLGPLSDWAQMKEHSAEYKRLKNKFDPDQGGVSPAAAMAADRNATLPPGQREPSFFSESRNSPTSPVVQAIEDAVTAPK